MVHRERLVEEWVAATCRTYPPHTARFLQDSRDPFRNPVAAAIQKGLAELSDELLGRFDESRVVMALQPIVRIRAVQDFTGDEAIEFVGAARAAVRTAGGDALDGQAAAEIESRISRMEGIARRLYAQCQTQIAVIRDEETRRRGLRTR